jgi:hypothetical protein
MHTGTGYDREGWGKVSMSFKAIKSFYAYTSPHATHRETRNKIPLLKAKLLPTTMFQVEYFLPSQVPYYSVVN